MDMTIKIKGERIITTIYAKPMALYQYIPPSSCHPPGVLTGLLFGQILRIYQLCSLSSDIDKELSLFYHRLLNRGYKPTNLLPLLEKGINNAITYLSLSPEQREARKKAKIGKLDKHIFLHIPYHPDHLFQFTKLKAGLMRLINLASLALCSKQVSCISNK